MALSWYNGHSPQKRERVQRWLADQWAADALPRPTRCIACGQDDGPIHGHLENYDTPTDYIDLCITCHLVLHSRFRYRSAWYAYRDRVACGWQAPPMEQRDAFRVLHRGILAQQWPQGRWRVDPPGQTFLDTLAIDPETRQQRLFS